MLDSEGCPKNQSSSVENNKIHIKIKNEGFHRKVEELEEATMEVNRGIVTSKMKTNWIEGTRETINSESQRSKRTDLESLLHSPEQNGGKDSCFKFQCHDA